MQIANAIATCHRPSSLLSSRSRYSYDQAAIFAAGKSAWIGASSASFACFCLAASFGSKPRFRSNSRVDSLGAWNALNVSSFAMMSFSLP